MKTFWDFLFGFLVRILLFETGFLQTCPRWTSSFADFVDAPFCIWDRYSFATWTTPPLELHGKICSSLYTTIHTAVHELNNHLTTAKFKVENSEQYSLISFFY